GLDIHAERVQRTTQIEYLFTRRGKVGEAPIETGDGGFSREVAGDDLIKALAQIAQIRLHLFEVHVESLVTALRFAQATLGDRVRERTALDEGTQVRVEPAQRHLILVLMLRHSVRPCLGKYRSGD